MSYRILSSNVIIGSDSVPDYALVATPDGAMQIERLDGNAAILRVEGNVEAEHMNLSTLTTENKVLTTDSAGKVLSTNFDVTGLGNATALTTGILPGDRLQGSYTLDNLTATGTVTVDGSFVANIDAANLTSGTLPAGRLLGGSYTFANLVLAETLEASTLVANISANNLTSGTVHPDRLAGSYAFDTLSLTGNLDAAWVHANIDASRLTAGVLSDDRLSGPYTFDSLTVTDVATTNTLHVTTLLGSNVLISNGDGSIVSSNVTADELAHVSGVVAPIQIQLNELANGNIVGSNITNLDADNITMGILPDARLDGAYSFADLTLTGNLVANSVSANLNASQLTSGTVPSARLAGDYQVTNLTATGTVTAAEVSGNLDADQVTTGTLPAGRLAGGTYTFESLTLSGNLSTHTLNANIDASYIVGGTVDTTRFDLEGLTTNIIPSSAGLTIGNVGNAWSTVYANTVYTDTIQLGNVITYNGNEVVVDLEYTNQNIVPTNATYTLGNTTTPWSHLYASNVFAAGNVVLSGSFLKEDGTPYFDLSNVETNVLPITSGLSVGTNARPWRNVVANTTTINTVSVSGTVLSSLIPSTDGLDLGSATNSWGNVYAANVHGNVDAADVYGELDASIVFTGGSIDDFVIKVPAGTTAQPGLRFIDDETTGVYLAAPGNVGITCANASVLTVDHATMTISGNIVPSAHATYDIGSTSHRWKDIHVSNGVYAGPVSIVDGNIDGVHSLTCDSVTTDTVLASGAVVASTFTGNLDASYLASGTIQSDRLAGDYSVNDLTITGNADIAGSTVLRPSGHIIPQADSTYDLGSAENVWRDLYLSGSTIHLGNASISEVGGNVVINKLNVSGSIIADGLIPELSISNVQITDSNWNPVDDTALPPEGGRFILNGIGFAPATLVKISNTNVSATSYVDATQLRVQVGARTPGTYDVSVIRGDTQTATLPSALHFSDVVTWTTSGNLGFIEYGQPYTLGLEALSDSQITYSNVDPLPPQTTLDPVTGNLVGNITSVDTSTLYSFDISAVDAELQDSVRTFLLQLVVP